MGLDAFDMSVGREQVVASMSIAECWWPWCGARLFANKKIDP
jgi:hypothetical protein